VKITNLIEGRLEYLIENHLICVKCDLGNDGAVSMYENPKTIEIIKIDGKKNKYFMN
jgi:hypothetical protein